MFSSQNSQVSNDANYIEDVFSTWLWTGVSGSSSINNGIDLAGKGGMVWIKSRSNAYNNWLTDTARGPLNIISSNLTDAQTNGGGIGIDSFTSTGWTFNGNNQLNPTGSTQASWTFRKQPKFFDVVTYTGDGVAAARAINHSLGSVPGCIMIKQTSGSGGNWYVYHAGTGNTSFLILNGTNAAFTGQTIWNSQTPSSTQFFMNNSTAINVAGETYVAYLFAHNAGGFGLTGTDNVISCGSFTTDGSGNATVSLGYEPQWVLVKTTGTASPWILIDTMRGYSQTQTNRLFPNASDAESDSGSAGGVNATGFSFNGQYGSGTSLIYIAIRRGPMKVPTDATKVFKPSAVSADNTTISTGFPVDMFLENLRTGSSGNTFLIDRLRGSSVKMSTALTAAESSSGSGNYVFDDNTGYQPDFFVSGSIAAYAFQRAPSFFDEVCYSGTGVTRTVNHNLGVVPEMWIIKNRTSSDSWFVGGSVLGSATADRTFLQLDYPKYSTANTWTTPSATTFGIGTAYQSGNGWNASGQNYVAYLFASCPGVSKVGSYTGTGTTLQVNCGFTAGSRFVLIKRTDSTGDWYVWDTARGIVSGNDPYLLLNSTAAETTTTDYIDPYSAGFEISSTAPAAINASGGTFIYLAIA